MFICFRSPKEFMGRRGPDVAAATARKSSPRFFFPGLAAAFLMALSAFFVASAAADDASEAGASGPEAVLADDKLALMAREQPLTEADLDVIIKLAEIPEAEADNFLSRHGVGGLRLELAMLKVSYGLALLSGWEPDEKSGVPPVLLPSAGELELIRLNLQRLAGTEAGPGGESGAGTQAPEGGR